MSTDGVLGAAYLPTDGYIDPSQLTFALAEGARRGGAEIYQHTRVTGDPGRARPRRPASSPTRARSRPRSSSTPAGCSRSEIGALAGVNVPIVPMAHEYLITKPSGLPTDMPTMRDPSLLVYFRPESGGLIMGGYERDPAPWSLDGIPADFNGKLLAEDWPRFEELMENAIVRVPSLADAEVIKLINGPEAFTPGRRVHPRADRGARALDGGRLLRARARRRRRASGSSSPSGSSRACRRSTSGTWTRAASAARTARASTRSPARSRCTRPTTT